LNRFAILASGIRRELIVLGRTIFYAVRQTRAVKIAFSDKMVNYVLTSELNGKVISLFINLADIMKLRFPAHEDGSPVVRRTAVTTLQLRFATQIRNAG
jgi:hypothetical protein